MKTEKSTLLKATKQDKRIAAFTAMRGGSYRGTIRLMAEASAAREKFRKARRPELKQGDE